jgi:hypothetical protein
MFEMIDKIYQPFLKDKRLNCNYLGAIRSR